MKKIILALLLFSFNYSFAQSLPDYDAIPLEEKEDYKAAEQHVLAAANSVFSVPFDRNEMHRLQSQRFVVRWMTGTPDYAFNLNINELKKFKGNEDLLGMYFLGLSKYALENPQNAKDDKVVSDNALQILIRYCQNPDNHLKMPKGLKKLASNSNG